MYDVFITTTLVCFLFGPAIPTSRFNFLQVFLTLVFTVFFMLIAAQIYCDI